MFCCIILKSKGALCGRCTAVGIFIVVHCSASKLKIRRLSGSICSETKILFVPFATCLKFAEGYYVNVDAAVRSLCFYRILLEKEGSFGLVSRNVTIAIFNIIYLHIYISLCII